MVNVIFKMYVNFSIWPAPTVVEEANGIWAASFVMQSPAIPQWFIMGDHDFQWGIYVYILNSPNNTKLFDFRRPHCIALIARHRSLLSERVAV